MTGFEIDFLAVGDGERSGDAIALRYGENGAYAIHAVDGGDKKTGERLVEHICKYYGNPRRIDHVVVTHGDDDHSSGIRTLIRNFEIGAIWMNRPWLYAAELVPHFKDTRYTVEGLARRLRSDFSILAEIEDLAAESGVPVSEAFQGAQIGAFRVLSPSRYRYLSLVPHFGRTPAPTIQQPGARRPTSLLGQPFGASIRSGASGPLARAAEAVQSGLEWVAENWGWETLSEEVETTASNESSVIQFANIDGRKILLTGDAGVVSLHEAATYARSQGVDLPGLWFVQVPHHGSRRNVSPSSLDRWLGPPVVEGKTRDTIAFASVGKGSETHPRRKVANAFIRRGAKVHVTKGQDKRLGFSMPERGWSPSVPLDFSNHVEA